MWKCFKNRGKATFFFVGLKKERAWHSELGKDEKQCKQELTACDPELMNVTCKRRFRVGRNCKQKEAVG